MKNVMTRAWEIAREGVKKFGGKVKEYFAQALVMAWAEVKKVMNINFKEVGKKNGMLYFVVSDIEGLEVSFLTTEKNFYNGKTYKKSHAMDGQVGMNKQTQEKIRMYSISLGNEAVQFKLGNNVEVLNINRGKLTWA